MNIQEKSKEEIILELQELQQKYELLKAKLIKEPDEMEMQILQKLIGVSEEFIQFKDSKPDYNKILQDILDISGAKYASFNIFDENGLHFTTTAIVGIKENIKKGLSFLGFNAVNKQWQHNQSRAEKIKNQAITEFDHLHELTADSIPKGVIQILEKTFNIEKVYVVKIVKEDKNIGDFTLLFNKGETLKNAKFVELFAHQVGMFLDRNKVAENLNTSESRHGKMIANIGDVIVIINKDGTNRYKSPSIEKWFGWTQAELIGKSTFDILHPDDIEYAQKFVVALMNNFNASGTTECRYLCKDGTYKWIEITLVNLLHDPDIQGILGNYHDISARKQTEEMLQRSESRSLALLHAMPDMIFIQDEQGVYLDFYLPENAIRCIPPKVFIGQKMENVLPHKIINDFEPIFKNAISTKQIQFYEYALSMPDEIHYFEARIMAYDDNEILSIVRDVTWQKKAINKLKLSEERFHALYDASFGGIAIHDKGLIMDCNHGLSEITGFTFDELIGMDGLNLIAPEWREFVMQKILSGYEGAYEAEGLRKDGSIYPLQIRGKNINYQNKTMRATEFRDTTWRKTAENALKESEQHYRTIVENTNDAIYIHDFDGKIIDVNDNVCKMLGYERNQIIGANLADFGSPQNAENMSERIETLKSLGQLRFEATDIHKDGTLITVDVSSTVVFHGGKQLIQSFVRDITPRKKAELIIQQHVEELKELNATKDKFFSIISHDLRSPFSNLLGLSELLLTNYTNYDDEKRKKFISALFETSKQTYTLVENLLEWSRMQRGKFEFNQEMVNITNLIILEIQNQKNISESKNIELTLLSTDEKMVYADSNMLRTVLRNLISNAIKFTKIGGRVFIYTMENNGFVEIAVSDNGVGISDEIMKKLFLFDSDYTTIGTANEKGTGLGLVLCKEFIEKHGGKIWAESEEGKGCEFKFTIPINKMDN